MAAQTQKCIICDKKSPDWPVADICTGFTFCDGCFREAKHCMIDANYTDEVSIWLGGIAIAREKHHKPK